MSQEETGYRLRKIVPLSVDTADARVREELQKEGFGVLTTIDVEATLREELGVDFRPYSSASPDAETWRTWPRR